DFPEAFRRPRNCPVTIPNSDSIARARLIRSSYNSEFRRSYTYNQSETTKPNDASRVLTTFGAEVASFDVSTLRATPEIVGNAASNLNRTSVSARQLAQISEYNFSSTSC